MQYDNETKELIKQLDKQAKEIQAKIDELKNGSNKYTRWRAKEGESFYIISGCAKIGNISYKMVEDFGVCCNFHYDTGDYFKTKEEAEKHYKNLIITQKLKDIVLRLNNGVEIDLKNWMDIERRKYKIVLKPHNNVLLQAISVSIVDLGQIYCLSDRFLETAIEEIGEQELIEYIKGC